MKRFALAASLSLAVAFYFEAVAVTIQDAVKAVRFTDWKDLWNEVWRREIGPLIAWDGEPSPPAVGERWKVTYEEQLRSQADVQSPNAQLHANDLSPSK